MKTRFQGFPVTIDDDKLGELEQAAKMACGLLRLLADSTPGRRAALFEEDSPVLDLIIDLETRLELARQDVRLGEIRGKEAGRAKAA